MWWSNVVPIVHMRYDSIPIILSVLIVSIKELIKSPWMVVYLFPLVVFKVYGE